MAHSSARMDQGNGAAEGYGPEFGAGDVGERAAEEAEEGGEERAIREPVE